MAPGFIDVQINGAFGVDFSTLPDGVEPEAAIQDGVATVAKGILRHGVTGFCPTVITSNKAAYRQILPNIVRSRGDQDGAGVLGVHLEGAKKKCGRLIADPHPPWP